MQKLFIILVLGCFASVAFAGQMQSIPVKMMNLDNLGRAQFMANALKATGLANQDGVKYREFHSIVVGGDERGSDHTGGYFLFGVKLLTKDGKQYSCYQYLSNGNFGNRYTRPIQCKEL